MIDTYSLYLDCLDRINQDEGGYLSPEKFNRYSWLGQLRMLDWLSGSVEGGAPAELANTQKNTDWISDFIVKYPKQVENGKVSKPDDYYLFQNGYQINGKVSNEKCADDEENEEENDYEIVPDTAITMLENSKFNTRANTFIESLKPTFNKAIAKIVGREFIFLPADLGSIGIEYVRYPSKSNMVMKIDPETNDLVYDQAASTQLEWGEFARPILVSFICREFYSNTKDIQSLQINQAIPVSR